MFIDFASNFVHAAYFRFLVTLGYFGENIMMFTDKQLSERPKSLYIILHGSNLSELFEL